jgi:D-proline reductase (dithiol) PrdA
VPRSATIALVQPETRIACDCPVLPLPALRIDRVPVERVVTGDVTALAGGTLTLDAAPPATADLASVVAATVDVIAPERRDVACDAILDVVPLAAKLDGRLGAGVTRLADGVVLVLTGRDEAGAQAGEFGDSSGVLGERLHAGACGTPGPADWIVRVHVVLETGSTKERRGPLGAHRAAERVAERVRAALRAVPASEVTAGEVLQEPRRRGGLRVLYAKLVMGQGAMHEKVLLPDEPAGLAGGRSIVDLGQGPLYLRANELRDGAIRSLCCVSPSTKETTLHHLRDPLLARIADDPTIDLVGVAVFGSPAAEVDKRFVAERVAALASGIGPDGAIVATEGFGNNHIDWAHAIAGILRHGVPTVGVTWAADQGRLVVGNEYLVALVEANGSARGRETLRLGENTATPAVADRAVTMLRSFVAGVDVLPAPPAWDAGVVAANQALVDAAGPAGVCDGLRSEIPVAALAAPLLAPLRVPVEEARIALVSAAGPYVRGDEPFAGAGDSTFRAIAAGTASADVAFGVGSYDHADVNADPNVMLPLDRLAELVADGVAGAAASEHYGFNGGGGDLDRLRGELAPQLLDRLRAMHADAVIFTGG